MGQFKTPLRYPGGKQRLTPFISDILTENCIVSHYCEPFAGGAGVGIELLLTRKIKHIHLNDSDFGIYAFWHSVKYQPEALCRMIAQASLTVEEWRRTRAIVRAQDKSDLLELGFSVFYQNRCNRSGVISAGIIGGLKQNGNYKMDARFSRNDLIRRIETIALFADNMSLTNLDAELYIDSYISSLPEDTLVYFDPPYFKKGGDLYLNAYTPSDHVQLAKKNPRCSLAQVDFILRWSS